MGIALEQEMKKMSLIEDLSNNDEIRNDNMNDVLQTAVFLYW